MRKYLVYNCYFSTIFAQMYEIFLIFASLKMKYKALVYL